jgi:hypothetical protein
MSPPRDSGPTNVKLNLADTRIDKRQEGEPRLIDRRKIDAFPVELALQAEHRDHVFNADRTVVALSLHEDACHRLMLTVVVAGVWGLVP